MMRIPCPWCGPRGEDEFHCAGEAHMARPPEPAAVSDEGWAAYLHERENPKGMHRERWLHRYGCGQWFNVARHLVSHHIVAVYPMGEAPPAEEEA